MGGFNPLKNVDIWEDALTRQAAHDNCLTIVALACFILDDDNLIIPVCKGYLEVANKNNFLMLFAYPLGITKPAKPYKIMKITDAIKVFENGNLVIGLQFKFWY